MRIESIGRATLYHGDCMEALASLPPFDVVITDPVYPRLDYGWTYVPIEQFGFQCRQFYFWMQPASFKNQRHGCPRKRGGDNLPIRQKAVVAMKHDVLGHSA